MYTWSSTGVILLLPVSTNLATALFQLSCIHRWRIWRDLSAKYTPEPGKQTYQLLDGNCSGPKPWKERCCHQLVQHCYGATPCCTSKLHCHARQVVYDPFPLPVNVVRDLGVLIDSELSMKQHICKVSSTCFYHRIRRLKQVRRILGPQVTASLVSSFVTNRLDYCNALLTGLPKSTISPLQRVQNASARLLTGISVRDHITSALQQLHWLPIQYRIIYKLCILMHLVHTGRSPRYLASLVTASADLPARRDKRSASSQRYEVPRTVRWKSFLLCRTSRMEPPDELHMLSNTNTFCKQLKTLSVHFCLYSLTFRDALLVTIGVSGAIEMSCYTYT